MIRSARLARLLVAIAVMVSPAFFLLNARAEVRLPALISDHMVLQQHMPDRIWGWAAPGEAVSVSFRGQTVSATTDKDGAWQIVLKPLQPGPPSDLRVTGHNRLVVHDVLVGDVWLASGQSNMALNMDTAANSSAEEQQANYPDIRLFHVVMAVRDQPANDVKGQWELCSPQSVKKFSAVAYYFGRNLLQHEKLPVGLIESSVGGTPAEAWTSSETLKSDASLNYVYTEWQQHLAEYPALEPKYEQDLHAWQNRRKSAGAGEFTERPPRKPDGPGSPHSPSGLYNGMIVPLSPFSIRGVIWYQGENNGRDVTHAWIYRRVFPMMIENWRDLWGRQDLPFLFVQLPNLIPQKAWPILRESQSKALELRHTAMVVTIDVGDPQNMHPKNKVPVGERLALAARATVYGEPVEFSGPALHQAMREGAGVRIWFDHAKGLRSKTPGPLTGFEIAGADQKFVPAEASIEGDTVFVSSAAVPEPVAVRYAWASDPVASLTNAANLPAAPFRTLESAP